MASVREVKQQLDEAGEDVADAAQDSVRAAGNELHDLRAKLRANGAQLEDELRDAGERFVEGARTLRAAATEQVREHPLAAFGVAFAAGVLVSRLMRKR
jgi:ElaB/YqjD/DUF883 family membrane-anchored ribosome-binding protein